MKMFHLLIATAVFCALSTGLVAQEDKRTQSEQESEVIRIAELNIVDLPIKEALAKVTEISKKSDRAGNGVAITLDPQVDASKIKNISLNLKDIPLHDVIRVISALSGLQPKYEEISVVLVAAKPAP